MDISTIMLPSHICEPNVDAPRWIKDLCGLLTYGLGTRTTFSTTKLITEIAHMRTA